MIKPQRNECGIEVPKLYLSNIKKITYSQNKTTFQIPILCFGGQSRTNKNKQMAQIWPTLKSKVDAVFSFNSIKPKFISTVDGFRSLSCHFVPLSSCYHINFMLRTLSAMLVLVLQATEATFYINSNQIILFIFSPFIIIKLKIIQC